MQKTVRLQAELYRFRFYADFAVFLVLFQIFCIGSLNDAGTHKANLDRNPLFAFSPLGLLFCKSYDDKRRRQFFDVITSVD